MDTDIRDELDRSFGDGPPIDDLDLLLDRGRAAVRRRRLTGVATVALVAGVVAGIAVVSSGGSGTSLTPAPAGPPAASVSPTSPPVVPDSIEPDVVPVVWDDRLEDGLHSLNSPPVSLESDGFVHAQPGVEILRTIANPYDGRDISQSAAIEYVLDGETHWFAGAIQSGGLIFSTSTPALADVSFERWVATSAPTGRLPDDGWPGRTDVELVQLDGTSERLLPVQGATILEQRAHPRLPESFATAADQSAVAEVQLDGERWYVLARRSPNSPPQYIAVSANDGGATLDDFLAMARERYAEGGGGLL